MSKVNADAIKPRDTGLDITLGATGDTTVISADSINANTIKDSGGNTLWTSNGSGTLSSVNSGLKGNLSLLTTNTFSGTTSSSFTTGIDSTYDVYKFTFNAVSASSDNVFFTFNGSTDGGSNYNAIKTTTFFSAFHSEDDTYTDLAYATGNDLAQSTAYWNIVSGCGSDADQCLVGTVWLFAPSSTIFVKQVYTEIQNYTYSNDAGNQFTGGYFNTTSAINAIDFKMSSGNMDGEIKMYGLL